MAQRTKLSGAALAAELSGLSFPQPGIPASPAAPAPAEAAASPALQTESGQPASSASLPTARRTDRPAARPRGGRPAKAGVDGIPVNVRLSRSDHLALARLAGKLMVPGRPLPTVQDVVRSLIKGALKEPDLALRLSGRTD